MLSVSLEASFTSDGAFSLDATMSGLVDSVVGVDFGDVSFDPTDVLAAVANLSPPELQSVLAVVADVSAGIDVGVGDLVDADALLAPIRDLIAPLELLGGDFDLSAVGGEIDLTTIGVRLDETFGLLDGGPLEPIVAVLRSALPDIDITGGVGDVTAWVAGLVSLLQLVGGLLALESVAGKVEAHASLVADQLNSVQATGDAASLTALADLDLAARIGAVDLDSFAEVEGVLVDIERFSMAVRLTQESWSRGLGLGEAALIGLDVGGCRLQFDAARAALDEALLPRVAALATSVRAALDPVLAIDLPDPHASLDDTFDAIVELVAPLRGIIDGLETSALTDAISNAVDQVAAPVDAVVSTLETVATSIGGALREVGDLVDSIDLTPLTDGVAEVLAPVRTALDEIDAAIAAGQDAIEAVATAITTALTEVTDAIAVVADAVNAALGSLSTRLDAVDFQAIQDALAGGLGQVASMLASAQLSPYFDAANDVIDTTADVIDAVPFGVLPTDVQQEIVDLSRPVKQIEFDAIAAALRAELDAIVEALDEDVLDEVDAAYQAVLEFLRSVDPSAAIAEFEAGPFAELRATVDALDPEALLTEVEAALAPVRSLFDGVDLRAEVLAPVEGVFGDVRAQVDTLDPAALLAPVTAEVDAFRQSIVDDLRLTEWSAKLTESRDQIVALLTQLDPAVFAEAAASGAIGRIRSRPNDGPGAIGQIVSAIAQGSGLAAEAEAWRAVRTWFGGVDGSFEVEHRLTLGAGQLESTAAAVRLLDPAPVVSTAQTAHRRAVQAIQNLPTDSRLRIAGEPLLVDNAPSLVLAPLIENRQRYLARLESDASELASLSTSGSSQVTVVTDGLLDALRPVTGLTAWVRELLGRFGLGDLDRPWSELLADLLDALGPDRLLPVIAELVDALRTKIIEVVDAAITPAEDAVATAESAIDLIDLHPIVDELAGVHGGVLALIDAVDPAVLLGPTLDDADAVIDRVAGFDPLEPVRAVIDALRETIDTVFDTVTPSIVFAPAIDIFDTILSLAEGLDVKGLLQPVLDALGELSEQLDIGIDETAQALGRLQAALPDRVEDAAASVSGSVSGSLSL